MVKPATDALVSSTNRAIAEERDLATSIRLSDVLAAGSRLTAASYSIEVRETLAELRASNLTLTPLYGKDGLCHAAQNAFRFKRTYVAADRGVPFLSSSDIISMRPAVKNYLSPKTTKRLPDLLIRKWDVLISCSGTVGNVGLASEIMAGKAVSQHVIRMTAPDPATAGYVAAFLRSTFGRPQLTQSVYGSVVNHIEPEHLTHVLIPDLPPIRRIAIGEKVVEAYEQRDESDRLLNQADGLLHFRLGLTPLAQVAGEARAQRHTKIRASRLNGRLDASYHDPAAMIAKAHLEQLPSALITAGNERLTREVVAVTKFRKRIYVDHGGIPLLNSKQLFQIDPVGVEGLAKGAHLKDLPEIELRAGMILVTRSGTIGRIQIVPEYMDGWTASEDALRIVPIDDIAAGYLYAWLASDYGYVLIRRETYGSVVVHIDREMLAAVPVPFPALEVRKEIAALVLRANQLRNEAWIKERKAIAQVEGLIRGGFATQNSSEENPSISS